MSSAVIATTPEGVVLLWNKAATELYQWPEREAVGRNIMTLTPSLQSKAEAEQVMSSLRAGRAWEGKIVLRRRDGTPFNAYVADIPVGGEEPLLLGISGVAKHRDTILAHAAEAQRLCSMT